MPPETATPELPKAPTAPSSVDAFIAATLKAGQENRELTKGLVESMGALLPQYEEAQDYEKKSLEARGQRLEGIEAKQQEMAKDVAATEVPTPPKEPGVPHITLRPFGEGLPGEGAAQTLNRTMMSLGLLAQMGFGLAKNYPQGALAAFTGALTGWQRGDRERAEQDWLEYQAQVGKAAREWQKNVSRFYMTRRAHADNAEQLKMQMGIEAAKAGVDDRMIQMMFQKPDEAMKVLGMQGKAIQDLLNGNQQLNKDMLTARMQEQKLAIEKQHLQLARDKAAQGMKPLGEKAAHWTNTAGGHPSPLMSMADATAAGFFPFQGKVAPEVASRITISAVDQALGLIPALEKKGLLMSGPGAGPWLSTMLKREVTQRGDPDLTTFVSHTSTLVRTARELGDIGFRAQAAIRGTTDLVEKAQTAEGVKKSLTQLRNLLELAAPTTVPRTLRVYNTKDSKYQNVILEPGETLNNLPEYMDPNR